MLSLYGTLEPLRLLLRVSTYYVVLRIRLASSRAAFSPLSPRALHQMATKKGPVAQAFDLHYYSVATRRLFSDLAKDVFWGVQSSTCIKTAAFQRLWLQWQWSLI